MHLKNDAQVIIEVTKRNGRPPRPPQPAEDRGLTDEVWSLIEDCWATQPGDRPNVTTIVSRIRSIIASPPPADPVEHQTESSDMDYSQFMPGAWGCSPE